MVPYSTRLLWLDVDFSYCWLNLVEAWFSLEQYIGLKPMYCSRENQASTRLLCFFCVYLKDAYLLIPVVKYKYYHHFHGLFGNINLFSRRFCHWACCSPRVFASLTKSILFLCWCMGFHIKIYWMISWSWLAQSMLARGHEYFVLSIG